MTSLLPARPNVLVLTGGDLLEVDLAVLDPIKKLADVKIATDRESLEREIVSADILLVWDFRFASLGELLPSATSLRWIHAASVGVDALLTPELARMGIVLTNSRGVFDRAIAEYVLGVFLMHLKDLKRTVQFQAEKRWDHRLTGLAQGARAVVVGSGSIGREIGRTLKAMDVTVDLVGRRFVENDPTFGTIRPSSELAEIVADADLLVLAAPGTAANHHLVDGRIIAALPSHAYLVNVGRGSLLDEAALIESLAAGQIAGAALDVFSTEPLPADSALWRDERVLVSPHMSADFRGFDVALVDVFLENLRRFTSELDLTGVVDLDLGYVPSQ